MHVHGTQTNMNAINPYCAAAERALAAQRAADVRKKLTKVAADIEGAGSPEETQMLGQWMGSQPASVPNQPGSASGKVSEFG